MIVVLLLVIACLVWLVSRRSMATRHRPRKGEMPAQRTLFNLQVGDVVQRDMRDWIVETILLFDQSGFQWQEYYLRDGDDGVWLVVVDDDRLELSWMHQVPSHQVSIAFPLRDRLTYDGVDYRLEEKGLATYSKLSRGSTQGGPCRFHDYVAEGGRVLSVELYVQDAAVETGEIELCLGERINPESLRILPGDGRGVYA